MRFFCILILATCSATVTSSKCLAEVLLGNFNENLGGDSAGFDSSGAYSLGFTVGNSPLTFNSVNLRLSANASPVNATLELRNDNLGNPANSAFLTFGSLVIASGGSAPYSFVPTASPTLAANTTYWLTIGNDASSPNGLVVAGTAPAAVLSQPFATFAGLRSGTPSSQTFDITGFAPVPSFQLNGVTAVPEPSSVALLTLVTTGLVYRRRRLKKHLGSLIA